MNNKVKSIKDSFVTKFAKAFLDTTGAWERDYNDNGKPLPYLECQRFEQYQYKQQAFDILKYFLMLNKTDVKDRLIRYEQDAWKRAGFPLHKYPSLDAELNKIIERRIGEPRSV